MTREQHSSSPGSAEQVQGQIGRMAKELGDSAHQVWLAGIGALARAQAEGSRLFEQLAEEGRNVGDADEAGTSAASRLEGMRQTLDGAFGRAQAKAGDAWDSIGRSFEQRVQHALKQMDVPTRDDLNALGARIDALTRQLQQRTHAENRGPTDPL